MVAAVEVVHQQRAALTPALCSIAPHHPKASVWPLGIHCSIEVAPLLFNSDIGLINTVRIIGDAQVWSTPLVELRRIALGPALYGRMSDGDSALPREFFDITIAQGGPQLPPYRTEDDVDFKEAPFAQGRFAHGRSPMI
jgi:hypothetical protein